MHALLGMGGAASMPAPPAPISMSRVPSRAAGDPWAVLPDSASAEEEAAADAAYAQIRADCERSGAQFTDETFPPSRASLGTGGVVTMTLVEVSGGSRRRIDARVPVVWRRPRDIADENGEYCDQATNTAPVALKRRAEGSGLSRQDSTGDHDSFEVSATESSTLAKFANVRGARTPVPWMLRSGFLQPEDVVQGQLGVCWFVSAMSVVAERRDLMLRLFRALPQMDGLRSRVDPDAVARIPATPFGCYQMRLCIDGLWRIVTVDDHIPVNSVTGEVAYTSSSRRQLWAPLLEKAAAKLVGSYGRLASGTVREGLQLLTGARTERIFLRTNETQEGHTARHNRLWRRAKRGCDDDEDAVAAVADIMDWECNFDMEPPRPVRDELWARMSEFHKRGYPMGAACSSASHTDFLVDDDGATAAQRAMAIHQAEARNVELERIGLVINHAYSVVDLQIAPMSGTRLVRIRNPWSAGGSAAGGKAVWKGAWADDSPLWDREPGLKERLGAFMQREGGIFWMSLEDFMKYFERLDVAYASRPEAGSSVTRVVLPLLRSSDSELCVIQMTPLAPANVQLLAHQQPRLLTDTSASAGSALRLAGGIVGAPRYVRDDDMYDHDLGMIVVTEGGSRADDPSTATGFQYIGGAKRAMTTTVAADVTLPAPEKPYYVMLSTFNRYAESAASSPSEGVIGGGALWWMHTTADDAVVRTGTAATAGLGSHFAVVAVQSSAPVLVEVVRKPVSWMARALACAVVVAGEPALSGRSLESYQMRISRYDEPAGTVYVAMNQNPERSLRVSLKMAAMKNVCHTRAQLGHAKADDPSRPQPLTSELVTTDVIGPLSWRVLAIVAQHGNASRGWSSSISASTCSDAPASQPSVRSPGLHWPIGCM